MEKNWIPALTQSVLNSNWCSLIEPSRNNTLYNNRLCLGAFLSVERGYLFCKSTFFHISTSSCDPSYWLRAQNAASALCCGSWERLGVGQGWHWQRDAGEVWCPKKAYHTFTGSYFCQVDCTVHKVLFTNWFVRRVQDTDKNVCVCVCKLLIDSCPLRAKCQCVHDWLLTPD